jgi:hypothetical protein
MNVPAWRKENKNGERTHGRLKFYKTTALLKFAEKKKSLSDQAYFCHGSRGVWKKARSSL